MAGSRLARWFKRLLPRFAGSGGRVLVIDPDPDAFALIATHLSHAKIRLAAAATPGEAFDFIHRQASDPPHAFVISFRQAGGTSGVETAKLLGNIRTVSRAPVILVHDRMAEDRFMTMKRALPRAEFLERPYAGKRMHDMVVAAARRGQKRPAARSSITGGQAIPPPPRARWRG